MNLGLTEVFLTIVVWELAIWAFYALVRGAVCSALQDFFKATRNELATLIREAVTKATEQKGVRQCTSLPCSS